MLILGAVLAVAFFFAILKWWSEGIFEASDAILLAVVFCGLIFGLFAAKKPWQFVLASVPLAIAAGYTIYQIKIGGVRHFLKRRCEEYMRAIEFDPRNLGAREYLADSLYNLGDLDRAVAEMQVAVDMGAGIECQYKVNKWSHQLHLRETLNPVCKWCQTEHSPGARKCSKCGSDLPYQNAFSRWLTGGGKGRARLWLIAIAGIALAAVSFVLLPVKFATIPIAFVVVVFSGWWLVGSAKS